MFTNTLSYRVAAICCVIRCSVSINLLGLSVSVAFCALLFFHMRYEQSFDRFHAKGTGCIGWR